MSSQHVLCVALWTAVFVASVSSRDFLHRAEFSDLESQQALDHNRLRREATVRYDCITPLFQKLQSCCPVPWLVAPEHLKRCSDGEANVNHGLFHTIRDKVFKNTRKSDPDADLRAVEATMCFIECVFKDMKLVQDDVVDVAKAEERFLSILKNKTIYLPWLPTVTEAVANCTSEIENLPVPTVTYNKTTCSTQPGVFMACVRRALILNCVNSTLFATTSPDCVVARTQLERCKPVDVLKAVTKLGESKQMQEFKQTTESKQTEPKQTTEQKQTTEPKQTSESMQAEESESRQIPESKQTESKQIAETKQMEPKQTADIKQTKPKQSAEFKKSAKEKRTWHFFEY